MVSCAFGMFYCMMKEVMRVSLVIGIFCMNLDDLAPDIAGFRVPHHVIANFEFRSHDGSRSVIAISNSMHCDV